MTVDYLVKFHESLGHKILVFSDVVWALEKYSKTLQRPYIHGKVNNEDRLQWFEQFIINPECNTLFMSRVGDVAVDLPAANVIIQVSSHFGSRRQEAQRLGRILRPDENRRESDVVRADRPAEAFFYSLVSMDTQETYYSTKRQAFLVDQGYTFKVVTGLPPPRPGQREGPVPQLHVREEGGPAEPAGGDTDAAGRQGGTQGGQGGHQGGPGGADGPGAGGEAAGDDGGHGKRNHDTRDRMRDFLDQTRLKTKTRDENTSRGTTREGKRRDSRRENTRRDKMCEERDEAQGVNTRLDEVRETRKRKKVSPSVFSILRGPGPIRSG